MSDLAPTVLTLLREHASAERWAEILAPQVEFEALRVKLAGRESVAERLGGGRYAHLEWRRLERPGVVLFGRPRPGMLGRGLAVAVSQAGGRIVRFTQQGVVVGPMLPDAPMEMGADLRGRLDRALAEQHPMSVAYVDREGRPHLSLRGSIRSGGDDRLVMWARPGSGMAAALAHNPNVALMYRDESARATYHFLGRARVSDDEVERRRIFDGLPEVERQHDLALLGEAIVIELDLVEGQAGFGPEGQIDPVRLVRSRAD